MSTDNTLRAVIHAELGGWPCDIELEISPARLGAALARLAELGYTPRLPTPPAPSAQVRPARPKVEPVYQPDGTPCCPTHLRRLTEGQYGLYCSAKATEGQPADARGYCGLKFK